MSKLSNDVLEHIKMISLTIEQVFGKNSIPYIEEYIKFIENSPKDVQEISVHDEPWNVATKLLGYGKNYDTDYYYNKLYNKLMYENFNDSSN